MVYRHFDYFFFTNRRHSPLETTSLVEKKLNNINLSVICMETFANKLLHHILIVHIILACSILTLNHTHLRSPHTSVSLFWWAKLIMCASSHSGLFLFIAAACVCVYMLPVYLTLTFFDRKLKLVLWLNPLNYLYTHILHIYIFY